MLRDHLLDHLARTGRESSELIFGRTPHDPLTPNMLQRRADKAWGTTNARERKAAEREDRDPELLERITPHACRHTFASLMIAAGVNAKALSVFMGHSNISITLDRYGHLMPGSGGEAAELLDGYLEAQRERAEEQARPAGGDLPRPVAPQSRPSETGNNRTQPDRKWLRQAKSRSVSSGSRMWIIVFVTVYVL